MGESILAKGSAVRRRPPSETGRRLPVWTTVLLLLTLGAFAPRPANAQGVAFEQAYARSLMLAGKGNDAGALAALQKALRLAPGRVDLHLRAAALETRLGKLEAAERRLREVLRREPGRPDASRELGGLLLLRGKTPAAAKLLAGLVDARPRDGTARYYLGLAQRALGRRAEARASLTAALGLRPAVASQAHYQLALTLLQEGESGPARVELEASISANTHAGTVARARAALSSLGATPAQRRARPWSVAITLGSVYDSNVSLLPDLSGDLPLPAGVSLVSADSAVTSAAAGRLYTEIAFEGRPLRGRHTLALGGGLYQSKHLPGEVSGSFEPPYFDLTTFGAYLTYAYSTRAGDLPLRIEASGGHVEFFLDTFRSVRHYLQRPWARAALALGLKPWLSLRVAYQLALENYLGDDGEGTRDDRDGFEHTGAVELYFAPHRRVTVRLAMGAGLFGADGDQWDALFTFFGVEAGWRVLSWLSLSAGVDYQHRDFTHSRYVTTGTDLQSREVQRVDDRFGAFGRVRFDLWRFHISLIYAAQKNNSSARQLFGYARQIAGLEMGFRY